MIRYLSPIALILWANFSNAAIQNRDFWFHDDGDTIFIDGKRGAPLHIDYIGAPLTKPLTVRVTPNNPKLKIAAPICSFTKKNNDCRLTVQLKNQSEKVYGVHHFTVTEVGGSRGVLNTQAAADASTVGFGVGVQGKDMPYTIPVDMDTAPGAANGAPGRVVIVNATSEKRIYILNNLKYIDDSSESFQTNKFSLPPKVICYADWDLITNENRRNAYNIRYSLSTSGLFSDYERSTTRDITNPSDQIYNGPYETDDRNISSCSAKYAHVCASNKWGSWVVGLANFGSTDMEGGIRAGQIEILRDNSWHSGSFIYYEGSWDSNPLALLQIQGSTDGSENWDANAAAPSILEIKSAPPCSNY